MAMTISEKPVVDSLRGYHVDIVYDYVVLDKTQSAIAAEHGINHAWQVSAVVRAYNFDRTDKGGWPGVSRRQIAEFIEACDGGFVKATRESTETGITLGQFLKQPRMATASSRQVVVTHYDGDDEEDEGDEGAASGYEAWSDEEDEGGTGGRHLATSQRTPVYRRVSLPQRGNVAKRGVASQQTPIYRQVSLPQRGNDAKSVRQISVNLMALYLLIAMVGSLMLYALFVSVVVPAYHTAVFNSILFWQRMPVVERVHIRGHGIYIGEMRWWRPSGFGKLDSDQGRVYVGRFGAGRMNGVGAVFGGGHLEYLGQFRRNQFHGLGVYFGGDFKFIGMVRGGRRHGYGVELGDDGTWTYSHYSRGERTRLIATSDQGLAQGIQRNRYLSVGGGGKEFIVGQQARGEFHGLVFEGTQDGVYFGRYHRGTRNGYGVWVMHDGDLLFGYQTRRVMKRAIYYDSLGLNFGTLGRRGFTGYGMEYSRLGNIHVGHYRDGRRHGKVVFASPQGTIEEMIFRNGERLRAR